MCLMWLVLLSTDPSITSVDKEQLELAFTQDEMTILRLREGLHTTLDAMNETGLFDPIAKNQIWSRERRDLARQTWAVWTDYVLGLESISHFHRTFEELPTNSRSRSFQLHHAAFLAQYRTALDLLDRMHDDPSFDVVLNEAMPQSGLPENTLAGFKFRFLHISIAARFVTLGALNNAHSDGFTDALRLVVDEDRARIWHHGKGRGELMTLINGVNIAADVGHDSWFPIQKGLANAMGDVRVMRGHHSLIKKNHMPLIARRMRAGDIMLQRREWYLSNLGIPGYWTHAALYIGSVDDRALLSQQTDVRAWLDGLGHQGKSLDQAAITAFPDIHEFLITNDGGEENRVIEAIGEGVIFASLEHSAAADSLAVLRPKVKSLAVAQALWRAFHFVGRPYDYDFDFTTDTALVCSELVYKAFEGSLGLKLMPVAGRLMLAPNEMARVHSLEQSPFEFVLFLDGNEATDSAVFSEEEVFNKSWMRPKWHIVTHR